MEIRKISLDEKCFSVHHKQFEVLKDDYLKAVEDIKEPFGQQALQQFAVRYLEQDDGLIGLVRYKDNGENIIIDATVRYMI